jgi:hypothetical protein
MDTTSKKKHMDKRKVEEEEGEIEEYRALSLVCQYCSREFGYLIVADNKVETRIDIRRMLHDYRCFVVCERCSKEKGRSVRDQPEDNLRYVRTRMNE